MHAWNSRPSPSLPLSLLCAALFVAPAGGVRAQVSPLWDHYKVYREFPAVTFTRPLILTDQFESTQPLSFQLEWFMNPTEKRVVSTGQVYPINDLITHYSWWRIAEPDPFGALVAADNQFGTQSLRVHEGVYLLNPALKNQAGTPPIKNHYKCYACDGQPVNRPVVLQDQFGTWQAIATFPRYFCNPVRKTEAAADHPIVDPKQHYVCYEIQPPDPAVNVAFMFDQFVHDLNMTLTPGTFLCVPTDKTGVVSTRSSTWGRLKVIYR